MKKHVLTIIFTISIAFSGFAQGAKSVRIGYIDMEYILQNVPDYAEANNQLELKAQKWKQDLEAKKNEVTKLKDALRTEKVLLTKELIEEREEAITFLETEMSEMQQKRFGPNGDFIVQKEMLVKPIQDQIFNAVQDIADKKKYDFIFDKASDLTMLFANKRFNISDQVVRIIERAGKAEQRTKKQIKADEAREYKEEVEANNPELAAKKKGQEERQAALLAKQEQRKELQAQMRAEAETKRLQNLADREAKKNGTISKKIKPAVNANTPESIDNDTKTAAQLLQETKAADRKAILDARQKDFEDRKKAIEDRKAKTLADREAAKKARDEQKKITTPNK